MSPLVLMPSAPSSRLLATPPSSLPPQCAQVVFLEQVSASDYLGGVGPALFRAQTGCASWDPRSRARLLVSCGLDAPHVICTPTACRGQRVQTANYSPYLPAWVTFIIFSGPQRHVSSRWFLSLGAPQRRGRSGAWLSGAPPASAPGRVPTLRPSTTGEVGALGHRSGHYASVFSAAK